MSGIEKLRSLAVFEAMWSDGVWREAATKALSETDELLVALATERKRREEAEDFWYQEQQAHTAAVTRAEQAERERDEARAEVEKTARTNLAAIARWERAEADNAALLAWIGVVRDGLVNAGGRPGDRDVALANLRAMLARMRALEEVADRMAALAMHDEACQSDVTGARDPANCALCEYNTLKPETK